MVQLRGKRSFEIVPVYFQSIHFSILVIESIQISVQDNLVFKIYHIQLPKRSQLVLIHVLRLNGKVCVSARQPIEVELRAVDA